MSSFSTSLDEVNKDGQTVKFLLDTADSLYQNHNTEILAVNRRNDAEEDWNNKLATEMEDEYQNDWGQYEADFSQTLPESESYDAWAERMINEHRKKHSKITMVPKPQTKPSSWTPEDQNQFIKKEEEMRRLAKLNKASELRLQFLSKLRCMVRSEGTIELEDLPFDCKDDIHSICQHILFDVKEAKDVEVKRKALRELKRMWHPDKFSQKFSQRLAENIRETTMDKVNKIAQYLNTYDCSNPADD